MDMEINVKKMVEPRHTGYKNVELQATSRGMPTNPTSKSDTAKLAKMMLLVVLRFELQLISRTTPQFITRIKTITIIAGIVSRGTPEPPRGPTCPSY